MVGVAVLGATGSIGESALTVLARHRDRFRVVAITGGRNATALAARSKSFDPELIALTHPGEDTPAGWSTGPESLIEAATHPGADVVINGVVGAAGLEATLAALESGKRLALANKESLVTGGELVLDAMRRGGGSLIPVDSEHSAILQCLPGGSAAGVRRLILTASGGAFRERPLDDLADVTPADALRHPTWEMGAKITVDSATLANKALEVIEAHYLFGIDYDRIDVVIHPQSIIHSMVEFRDGSVLSQMGFPSMELPILYALTHPERVEDDGFRFDPVAAGPLTFAAMDPARFPTFGLGVDAGRAGGTAPAIFNAANETAVAAFLDESLNFTEIPRVIESTLRAVGTAPGGSLEAVLAADAGARVRARAMIEELS